MAKKSKKKGDGTKPETKALVSNDSNSSPVAEGDRVAHAEKEKPIIRAIRVTAEVLDAAKAYKKAKGVSFYTLGMEAISDRLVKEGFLKRGAE